MTDKKPSTVEELTKWKAELQEALIQAEMDLAKAQGIRYRTPEKAGRSRRAKSNASLSSIKTTIAKTYGLPEDAIVFMEPGLKRKCTTINVGQLRTKWNWEPTPEGKP